MRIGFAAIVLLIFSVPWTAQAQEAKTAFDKCLQAQGGYYDAQKGRFTIFKSTAEGGKARAQQIFNECRAKAKR
jgi:hypothetical protein